MAVVYIYGHGTVCFGIPDIGVLLRRRFAATQSQDLKRVIYLLWARLLLVGDGPKVHLLV